MPAFTLTTPCPNCPFRTDIQPYLRPERATEIASALTEGSLFYCHQTPGFEEDEDGFTTATIVARTRPCAGSLIVMEKSTGPNQMMRVSERLGFYDHSSLDMDAPVHASLHEWAQAQHG